MMVHDLGGGDDYHGCHDARLVDVFSFGTS